MKVTIRNFPRLDDEAVREMAKGIVTGERWVYDLDNRSSWMAAMWLALGVNFTEAAAKQLGAVIGRMDGTVARYLNGQPMTTSGWIIHRADWARVVDKLKLIEAVME